MIEKINEAHKELVTCLLAFQKKYSASFLELKQVVSYSLDSISSPQPGTGTLVYKPKVEHKAPSLPATQVSK